MGKNIDREPCGDSDQPDYAGYSNKKLAAVILGELEFRHMNDTQARTKVLEAVSRLQELAKIDESSVVKQLRAELRAKTVKLDKIEKILQT